MKLKIKEICFTQWSNEKLNPAENEDSIYNPSNILNNFAGIGEVFDILVLDENGNELSESDLDTGVRNSWFTAVECLGASQYAPALLFAAIAVECAINCDSRFEPIRKNKKNNNGWKNLTNNKILLDASSVGIPTSILCDDDESIKDIKHIRFIDRRNKIAHGDYSSYRKIPTVIEITPNRKSMSKSNLPTKEHALHQINKSKDFIFNWVMSKPIIID